MATYAELKRAALLMAGLNPAYTEQIVIDNSNGTALPGTPGQLSLITVGVDVSEAALALMRIILNEDPSAPRGWVWVTALDNSQTYTMTVGGTAYNYASDPTTTEDEVLDGLKALIDADGAAVAVCSRTVWNAKNVLLLVSKTSSPFTLTVSATGAATMDRAIEPTSVTVTIWGQGRDEVQPDEVSGYETKTVTANWTQRIEIGGLDWTYLETTASNGYTRLKVGPCLEDA